MKKSYLFLFLTLFFLSLSNSAFAVTNVSACGTLSSANTYYQLNQSISGEDCITISASNITLDGAGYTITYGTILTYGRGIIINSGLTNITVKNVTLQQGNINSGSSIGIDGKMSNSNIENNLFNTAATAIRLNLSNNNNITNNSYDPILNPSGNAIALYSSNNNVFSGDIFKIRSAQGFTAYYLSNISSNNDFINTTFGNSNKIYFDDSLSYFNYKKELDRNVTLRTNLSISDTLTRTITTWTAQTMKWSDTNTTLGVIAHYNLSGLNQNRLYYIYNLSNDIQTNVYNLTTSSSGELSFGIALSGATTINVTLDTVAPSLTISSPTNSTYTTTNISLNYTASDTNLNTTWYQYNGTNTTITSNTTFTSLEGASTLYLYANDSAGNINSTSVTFTVDSIAPTYTNLAVNSTNIRKNDTIKFSALWNDLFAGLSKFIFSWNVTGTWVNTTYDFSGNWSNVTVNMTANKTQEIAYIFFANDTYGNTNATTQASFIVNNTPPTATASIIPSPTDGSQPLNCSYTYVDNIDNDAESASWFRWYVNDSLLAFTSQNLSNNGNFSNGDNVICSVMVNDGTDNATSFSNSSQLTINDNIVPVLKNDSLSASSGYTNNVMNIFVNVTEANLMDWVYAEITDPNSVVTNYTMTQEAHTGTEWRFNRSYTPLVAGTYSFFFWARDQSGNVGSLDSNLSYSASVYVAPAPAGGGGGSDTVVVTLCGNKLCEYSENEATCAVDCAAKFVVLHPREDARLSKITDNGYQNGVYTSEFRVKNLVEEDLNLTFTSNTSWVKFTIDGYNSVYQYNGILRRKGATDSGISYVRINILANGSVGQVLMGTILISDGHTTTSVPVIFTITDSIGIEDILNNMYVKVLGGLLGIAAVLFFISKKRAI